MMQQQSNDPERVTLVIPAKNEEKSLRNLLPELSKQELIHKIIVINDGSTDNTAQICRDLGVQVITHPYSMGNGAAIKSGARAATGDIIIFMDADGQHRPEDIPRLLERLKGGYDMVVGARDSSGQASVGRLAANTLYNRLASWMVNKPVLDLTSGFRAVRAEKFREFLHLLPNGFSYPTTITMSFFRAGYAVGYVPIHAPERQGKSHIRPIHDGIRFLLIIFKIGTLYSPLKIFFPLSLLHLLVGFAYYGYTYLTFGRFTNMSALLLSTAVIIFLIGLVSEQITNLTYTIKQRD
jgi:glycosyltransferase involved in cell wall biosynthesis